jgi:hypothetical protein
MAQVVGGTDYDFMWDRKINIVHDRIKDAADLWSKDGKNGFDVGTLISIILRIFSEPWSSLTSAPQLKRETRRLDEWTQIITNPYEELCKLKTNQSGDIVNDTLKSLLAETKLAANEWAIGNPEEPPTYHMLNVIIHVLFKTKFIGRRQIQRRQNQYRVCNIGSARPGFTLPCLHSVIVSRPLS